MSEELQPGAHLGQYEIVRRLATGGMAEVYLAHRRGTAGFEKRVALKRILPGYAQDRAFVTMFLDEARLAATLRHANIASVFDVGAENHSYFFAMEFVHGQDVRAVRPKAWRQRYTLPLEIALAVATGTASALHYAHNKLDKRGASLHLVHRDISPSNILISYDGAVKLVDFGIARASSRSAAKTQTGLLRGKVPYLSPEQCRGQPLDARSDLFSLGTVLYELTTGVRPFRGESDFETMNQIVNSSAVPPTRVLDNYPPALESIVMTLLSPDRERRYQSAESLLADLERLSADEELFVTDLVVAKYMREHFAAQLEAETPSPPPPPPPPAPEPTTSEWGVSPQAFSEPTKMYPDGVPSELMAAINRQRMPPPLPDPEELPSLSEPEEPLPAFGAVPTSTDVVPTTVRTKPPRPPPRRSVPPPIAGDRATSEPEVYIERAPSSEPVAPRGGRAPSEEPRARPPSTEPPTAERVPRAVRPPSAELGPHARPPTGEPRPARPPSAEPVSRARPPSADPAPPTTARPPVPPPIAGARTTRPSVAPPIAEPRTTRSSVAPPIAEPRATRPSVPPPIAAARTTRPSVAPPIAEPRAARPSVPPPIADPPRRAARLSTPPPTIADAVKAALLPPALAINIRPTRELPKKSPEDDLAIPGGVVMSAFQHESSGIVLPFDPVDARSAEILDAVEASVPVAQHISAFLERAKTWFELGDLERAVSAIDLAMAEPSNAPLLEPHLDLVVRIFDAFLGPVDGQLVLAHALEELANVPLSPRAAFLLSRIDGSTTIEELLDISGMPRMEAKRYLCQLFLRGVVSR